MAFKIDIEDNQGMVRSHWVIEQITHTPAKQWRNIVVIGYKNKAAKLAGKQGIVVNVTLEGTPNNMSLNEIEAAVIEQPQFAGSVAD